MRIILLVSIMDTSTSRTSTVAPLVKRPLPADQNPAAVFLARLAPGSRRTMRGALETVAAILTSGRATADQIDWSALRYQHVAAIQHALASRFRPATANKVLSAVRGTLKDAWRLGHLTADEYQRAVD